MRFVQDALNKQKIKLNVFYEKWICELLKNYGRLTFIRWKVVF